MIENKEILYVVTLSLLFFDSRGADALFMTRNRDLWSLNYASIILGTIDAKELKVAMRALGFEPKKEEIKKMISGKAN